MSNAFLKAALNKLLATPSWDESRRVLEQYPVLLSPEAEALVAQWAAEARARGDADSVEGLMVTERALRECRESGIPMGLIEAATWMHEQRLRSRPPGSPERVETLYFFGNVLRERYALTRAPEDLERAITMVQEGVDGSAGHPRRAALLDSLSELLEQRFATGHDMWDLFKTVELAEQAVAAVPPGPPERPRLLAALGTRRWKSAVTLGPRIGPVDSQLIVDKALDELGQALAEADTRQRPAWLASYGGALKARYSILRESADLDEAIRTFLEVADVDWPDSPRRAFALHEAGGALRERFHRMHAFVDIDASVQALQRAIELLPPDHPERAARAAELNSAVAEMSQARG